LRKIFVLLILTFLMAGCAVNRYRSDFDFANKLAAEGLWKEAYFRLQKELPSKSSSAALHNNLAVALESLNRLPEAEQEYLQALKLDPRNSLIKSNYNLFMKNQRRDSNEK
jgi:Flp pilus assembly protein TadD